MTLWFPLNMITFKTIKYKNFLSAGNTWTEIDFQKHTTNLIIGTNGAGKSTMLDALTFVLFNKPFRKINSLRKAGKLQDAWNFGCPAVKESPNDAYLKGAFFWVCYDYLKQVQAKIKERAQQNYAWRNEKKGELFKVSKWRQKVN